MRRNPLAYPRPEGGLLPPRPGDCHAASCLEKSTHVVRVRRVGGGWTGGIDYCEPHAHEAATRMRETFKVVVEPA